MCDCLIVKRLKKIEKRLEKIMSVVTVFRDNVNAAFVAINASLDNISTDEANLAKQIVDLKAQIAAGGSNLTVEDQAALDTISASATAMSSKTATIADNVPDLPLLPPGA